MATESTAPLYFMIEILFNSYMKLRKHKQSGITRDSKRVFGIFRTMLPLLLESYLKEHLPYRLTLSYFLTGHHYEHTIRREFTARQCDFQVF